MTVEELRKKLEGYDPGMRVVYEATETSFNDIQIFDIIKIKNTSEEELWMGKWEKCRSEKAKETALLIA